MLEINDSGIKVNSAGCVVLVILALVAIGAATLAGIRRTEAEVEKAKIEQAERSTRGHWLWGHWSDSWTKPEGEKK